MLKKREGGEMALERTRPGAEISTGRSDTVDGQNPALPIIRNIP